ADEVDDRELLAAPIEGVDVLVTKKDANGKTLEELATRPAAHGLFLRKITRGATAVTIPILPATKIYRGDIITLVGRTQDVAAGMVHEFRRPEHIHCSGRHLIRTTLRRGPAATRVRSFSLGYRRHDGTVDLGDVCRQIRVPLPPGDTPGCLLGRTDDDSVARH